MGALHLYHFDSGRRVARHEVLSQTQVFDNELLTIGRVPVTVVSEQLLGVTVVRVLSSRVARRPKEPAHRHTYPKSPTPSMEEYGAFAIGRANNYNSSDCAKDEATFDRTQYPDAGESARQLLPQHSDYN